MPLTPIDQARRNASVLEKFYSETGITRTEQGSTGRALYDAIRNEIESVERRLDELVNAANPLTCSGPYLDQWLAWFGIERELTKRAHVRAEDKIVRLSPESVATFGDLNGGQPIQILASSFKAFAATRLITNRGFEEFDIQYELLEDVTLPAIATEFFITLVAVQPGSDQNIGAKQLKSHNFTDYSTYPDRKLKIENLQPITNGEDDEFDDNARGRMNRTAFLRPQSFIDNISSSINRIPGVTNVIPIENYSGSGTVDFFIDTQAFFISDTILNEARLRVRQFNNIGSLLSVERVRRLGIAIEASIKFKRGTTDSEKADILNDVEIQIMNDILNVRIGESMDLEELYRRLGLNFRQISSIGVTGKGFDSVTLYRDGLGSQRVGESLADPLSVIRLNEIERLLPEDSLIKPVVVRENNR